MRMYAIQEMAIELLQMPMIPIKYILDLILILRRILLWVTQVGIEYLMRQCLGSFRKELLVIAKTNGLQITVWIHTASQVCC